MFSRTNDAALQDDADLAELMAKDRSRQTLTAVVEALQTSRAKVKRHIDKGVTPAEFARLSALLTGYEAAIQGMDSAWNKRFSS